MQRKNQYPWLSLALIVCLLLESCSIPPTQSQTHPQTYNAAQGNTPISQRECLSDKANIPCFYWREMSTKKNEKLIVFVHGVFSNPSDTWGNVKSGITWPALVRDDERFKDFDIYLFNYRTTYLASAQMIQDIAIRQMNILKDSSDFQQYKEVYFIAHSMGGLIVKNLLTHLAPGDDVRILRRVKAAIFLGTPSQGADLAVLGTLLSFNPQLRDLQPKELNSWLSDLENYWKQLMDNRKDNQYPLAYCAYETLPYQWAWVFSKVIVPKEAAYSRCDDLDQGLPFDHSDLAMATSVNDDPYKWAMDKIFKVHSELLNTNNATVKASLDTAEAPIFFECDLTTLPKTIPLDGKIMGLNFVSRPPGDRSPIEFRSAGIPGERNTWARPDGYGYVCQLTNYGTEVVMDLQITFGLRFKEVIWRDEVGGQFTHGPTIFSDGWTVPIRKLDTGPPGRFVFYFKNTTRYWLDLYMPTSMELRLIRESKSRRVTLVLPNEGLLHNHIREGSSIVFPIVPGDWGSWRSK